MTNYRFIEIMALTTLLPIPACVTDSDTAEKLTAIGDSTAVHVMPLHSRDKIVDAAPPGAHLSFHGGPLLTAVHSAPLYWNANVQFRSTLNSFYNDVPNSPLYNMLAQYQIGHGNGQAGFVDNRSILELAVTDNTIQDVLLQQINAGNLPFPTTNTYYPVHFPPLVVITGPGTSVSCVQFCGYHSSFAIETDVGEIFDVNYGVLPDLGGACALGCGGNPSLVNNVTSVASHELVEATTDPVPNSGWFDVRNRQEIADLCNAQQGTTTGNGHNYVIQLEFSNAANNCVAQ